MQHNCMIVGGEGLSVRVYQILYTQMFDTLSNTRHTASELKSVSSVTTHDDSNSVVKNVRTMKLSFTNIYIPGICGHEYKNTTSHVYVQMGLPPIRSHSGNISYSKWHLVPNMHGKKNAHLKQVANTSSAEYNSSWIWGLYAIPRFVKCQGHSKKNKETNYLM
jgi:hypothetical protein